MAGGTPQMRRNLSMEDVLGLAGSLTKHSSATFPRTDSEQAFQVRSWPPRFPPTGPRVPSHPLGGQHLGRCAGCCDESGSLRRTPPHAVAP